MRLQLVKEFDIVGLLSHWCGSAWDEVSTLIGDDAIFPSLSAFLSKPGRSRLVARLKTDTGERVMEEVTNTIYLARRAAASRSTSPTKRSRVDVECCDEVHSRLKRHRICEDFSSLPSFNSTLPTLDGDDNYQLEMQLSEPEHPRGDRRSVDLQAGELCSTNSEQNRIETLRSEALLSQRPKGFIARKPQYHRNRPAKEELEIMGVEIMETLDDEDLA